MYIVCLVTSCVCVVYDAMLLQLFVRVCGCCACLCLRECARVRVCLCCVVVLSC